MWKSLPIYEIIEKNIAVVKKGRSMYGTYINYTFIYDWSYMYDMILYVRTACMAHIQFCYIVHTEPTEEGQTQSRPSSTTSSQGKRKSQANSSGSSANSLAVPERREMRRQRTRNKYVMISCRSLWEIPAHSFRLWVNLSRS